MTDLVTISIAVSRAEAVVVASMLEGYGIPVHLGSDRQNSTEYWSLAFGGYRLWVSEEDHAIASEIIRQSGALEASQITSGPRRPLLWLLAFWFSTKVATVAAMSALAPVPLHIAAAMIVDSVMIPVNPQGRADYFLFQPS